MTAAGFIPRVLGVVKYLEHEKRGFKPALAHVISIIYSHAIRGMNPAAVIAGSAQSTFSKRDRRTEFPSGKLLLRDQSVIAHSHNLFRKFR